MTSPPSAIPIRPSTPDDLPWITARLEESWGDVLVVTRGQLHDASRHPALIAEIDGSPCGLATYRLEGANCELLTLNAFVFRSGVGTALLKELERTLEETACRRLWLITTNDNVDALRFYQRRGFHLAALHPGAIDRSRQLKPTIPAIGDYGIPLRDEIELEKEIGF